MDARVKWSNQVNEKNSIEKMMGMKNVMENVKENCGMHFDGNEWSPINVIIRNL